MDDGGGVIDRDGSSSHITRRGSFDSGQCQSNRKETTVTENPWCGHRLSFFLLALVNQNTVCPLLTHVLFTFRLVLYPP